MTQLDDTLSRGAEGKKEPEPPKAWKNRWRTGAWGAAPFCEACHQPTTERGPFEVYVSHCRVFPSKELAEQSASESLAAQEHNLPECRHEYLGAFPVPVSP